MLDRYASIERGDEAPVRQRATNLLLGFRKLPLQFLA
jgi:hypothetical protein